MIFFRECLSEDGKSTENGGVLTEKTNIFDRDTEDVHYFMLTSKGEERKLPIKALKERATGIGFQRHGGWCKPWEEPASCSSRAGRKKAKAQVEPSRDCRVRA